MRKPEQRVWDAMRANCPPDVLLDRIENLAGVGTPDLYAKAQKARRSCWIEMKATVRPKRAATPMMRSSGLSPEQINWHLRRHVEFGIPTFVLVRDDQLQIYLIEGAHAVDVNSLSQPQLAKLSLASSWGAVWTVLRGL